jgi:hypothetical protein
MRLNPLTDGRQHSTDYDANDHHAEPVSVNFSNTSQSIGAGSNYTMDVALGRSDFQLARVMLLGPKPAAIMGNWDECAELIVTRDANEAMGHSVRAASTKKVYAVCYSKQNADSYLTQRIFNTGSSSNFYIGITSAVLTGSNLRMVFHNYHGSSVTLNVRGHALLW